MPTSAALHRRAVLHAAAGLTVAGAAHGPAWSQLYVEEIGSPPTPIPQLESCLPAFIGYTQKADDKSAGDLLLRPTRISSLSMFERYFGGPKPETAVTVTISSAATRTGRTAGQQVVAQLQPSARSRHILHYALQMFFANGGGDCIIISVGAYKPVVGDLPVADDLQAGLDVLRTTDGPTLIVMPEAQSLPVQGYRRLHDAALAQCAERQDRFLIMDMHAGGTPTAEPVTTSVFLNDVQAFRDNAIGAAHLGYGAVYAPNLSTTLPLSIDEGTTRIIGASSGGRADLETLADLRKRNRSLYTLSRKTLAGLTNILPPSGAIAGLYARTDRDQGVWKSPANAQLANVTAPMVQIDGAALDEMRTDTDSGKSINPVRTLPGRGVLVWGGRTLAGNDPEWQYIATRRFITFVETSVRKGLEQFVFEPNVAQTWIRANTVVTDFLTGLWRQGALQGQVPAQAFGVSVGLGSTMTREDVEAGRMILLLSLATTRPAEFISIRVTQQVATP